MTRTTFIRSLFLVLLFAFASNAAAWWNDAWTGRTKFVIDPKAEGAEIKGEAGEAVVLVRLFPGNLPFESVLSDGSDLRFVAADDKTPLSFHLEKFDPLMAEGFAWVRLPSIGESAPTEFWLYYGNEAPEGEGAPDAKATYPESARIVYHLGENGTPPQDSTTQGANAETAGSLSQGTIIADGVRLVGREPIKIPGTPENEWRSAGEFTVVFWLKALATANEAVLFSRPEAQNFIIGLAVGGAPFIEVGGSRTTANNATVAAATWQQLAAVAKAGRISLYLDGREVATADAPLPAGGGPMYLGGPDPALSSEGRFLGEFDEFQLYASAWPGAALRFAAVNQAGNEVSTRLLAASEAEGGGGGGGGHGGALEHVMLFGDIASNMMFDGWIAVAVCVLMMIVGWWVAFAKFRDLSRIEKGNARFLRLWGEISSDLTALDKDNRDGGTSEDPLVAASPLYHVYHVGSDEIRHRLQQDRYRGQGLRARSIQAIRAALDTALVREQQRLNKGIVYLTVSIAGGPYVGLLGTVVGVMITFAIIAKSGEVDVNSIAPGIASALLATTVGLLVAIPALFMYSFLNQRIKGVIASMQVFIDEFVAKVAEFYPPPGEDGAPAPIRTIRTPEEVARHEEQQQPAEA